MAIFTLVKKRNLLNINVYKFLSKYIYILRGGVMMSLRKKGLLGFILGLALLLVLAACGGGSDDTSSETGDTSDSGDDAEVEASDDDVVVNIRSLWDITGGSGDTGTPYSEGQTDYFKYIASTNKFEGLHIDHRGQDYGYEISDAQRTYQEYRDRDNAVGILGWGTGDTEAMREQVAADEIPYISASYSEALNNTSENPYNFFIAASYSDQGRMIIDWIKENHEGDNPTFGIVYGDNAFGRSPIDDIKEYAEAAGVEHVGDYIVELDATEAQSQVLTMQSDNPDYVLIQETWGATGVTLREAKTLGLDDTVFIGLNQAVGEGLIEQVGEEVTEGFIGILTHALPYEDIEGMNEYKEFLESEGKSIEDINMQHVAGWVSAQVIVEAARIAVEEKGGEITGADLRDALETLDNFDNGGLSAPVSFSSDDHAGTNQARLGQIKDGKWEPITDYFGVKN